jgi:hypothetical protein
MHAEMFEKYSKVDFDTKIRDWARYYYYDPSDAINAYTQMKIKW